MKKKVFSSLLVVMFAAASILSACSGDGDNTASAEEASVSSVASSTSAEPEPVVSDAESLEAVDASSGDEAEEDVEKPNTVRIDADGGLRMRGGPGTDYDIIKTIPKNEYAELAKSDETHTDWLYVQYDGDYGWVSAEFVVHEEKPASIQVSDWAKVYYDYLDSMKLVRHTDVCDYEWCNESWSVFKEKSADENSIVIYGAQFRHYSQYDYPVMVNFIGPLKGHTEGGYQIMLIENGKAVALYWSDPRSDAFFDYSDSYPELKGDLVKEFNDDEDDALTQVLLWLKEQM